MFKKMIVVAILVALAGVLLVGAVNRTLAKTGEGGSGETRQNGWGVSRAASQDAAFAGQGGGNGQGGRWANAGDPANGQGGRWASASGGYGNGRGGQGNGRGAGGQGGGGARP